MGRKVDWTGIEVEVHDRDAIIHVTVNLLLCHGPRLF